MAPLLKITHKLLSSVVTTTSRFKPSSRYFEPASVLSAARSSDQPVLSSFLQQPLFFTFHHKCVNSIRRKASNFSRFHSSFAANPVLNLNLDSIVKVFTVSSSPSYFLPWQNKPQREITGSGFVIEGRRIITNAHVVADQTFVTVRRHGSPVKYRAVVESVGHDCDIAVLTVQDAAFWSNMPSLQLGAIPELQEEVAVLGYPHGGDNICVTAGVVSRVELTQYVHGASHLMAIQIDAAINPGNSGGPAIMDGKVVGIAFQNLPNSENVGYLIPTPVVKQFLDQVEDKGYQGFCSLGATCQSLENEQLRSYLRLGREGGGVLVNRLHPLSHAYEVLKKDDVLVAIDGHDIASDGSVHFRNRERISFDCLVSLKKPGGTGLVGVIRDGQHLELRIRLEPLKPLVPVHQFDELPSYFIFAGMVFTQLTQPYLHEYGDDWFNISPRKLCELALRAVPSKPGQQIIIISQILSHEVNTGYERLASLQVKMVNGCEVDNLKHMLHLVKGSDRDVVRLDLDDSRTIIVDRKAANFADIEIMKLYRISALMSTNLASVADLTESEREVQE